MPAAMLPRPRQAEPSTIDLTAGVTIPAGAASLGDGDGDYGSRACPATRKGPLRPGAGLSTLGLRRTGDQWKLSPHAQEPVALGLSMVKPCFSMVSTKSMTAPER